MAKKASGSKKADYPKFDDTEYVAYLKQLHDKYVNALEEITGYDGLHHSLMRDESKIATLKEKLADFDYAEISATLGAQDRWPPKDDYMGSEQTYEFFGTLSQKLKESFDGKTTENFAMLLDEFAGHVKSGGSMAGYGFNGLRLLKKTLDWLAEKFPQVDSERLSEMRAKVAREFDPRWATMSAGPLHDKYMGEIRFSSSNALPLFDEWPESLNPAKDYIYAHVFLDRAMKDIAMGDMLFIQAGNERYQFNLRFMPGDQAYVCLYILPESSRNPDLIRTMGKALLAADGELRFVFTPIVEESAVGTLKMKMTKAEAGKLAERIEELAKRAEANQTAANVLPEIFVKSQKWPYKDKALAQENVIAAIEEAWEYNSKEKIKVRHLRVNHYRPGWEWDLEVDPWERPTQRLTFSYVGMIYERDGKTFCVDDGIQFRQFPMPGKGFSEDLNVLFWGVNPFELPPEQVKRIAK